MEKSKIKLERKRSGMSISKMAKLLDISYTTYWRKENNPHNFTVKEVELLLAYFDKEFYDLF